MRTALQGGSIECGRIVVREPWQFVLLNSQVPGDSHGFLPSSELTALEEAHQRAPDRYTLVGLHHGPLVVCPMEPCQLRNAEEFLALLQRYPSVRGVISGHNHCLVEASQGHLRLLVTPSTCVNGEHPGATDSLEGRAFWDVHRLTPGQGAFRRLELSRDGQIATEVIWVNHETPLRSAPDSCA